MHINTLKHPAGSLRRFVNVVHSAFPTVRLVCFPNAGAGASVYRRFVQCLPKSIDLLSVQLPGREDRMREQPYQHMQQAATDIARDIARLPLLPTVLFGHSMGALLAFETATILSQQANFSAFHNSRLIVSGHDAPDIPDRSTRCRGNADDAAFLQDLTSLGGTPPELLNNLAMKKMIIQTMRYDYTLLDNYRYQERSPLGWPLLACAARQDTEVTCETVAAWKRHTTKVFTQHWFDGDHFYLFADPKTFCAYLQSQVLF